MSDSCPLPIDWLDYLEGEKPAEMKEHLHDCPSCREALSLLGEQVGNVPSPTWTKHLTGLEDAHLTEERAVNPAPAELWFSAGEWTFHDTEYRPPERSLVLVLSEASREIGEHSWYDVAPVRTDVEEALPTDLLVTAKESSLNCSLRIVLTFECKVERRQLESRVGRITDIDLVISALGDETSAWRWGNPLESPEDTRLWWEPGFSETMDALREPWLQYLDDSQDEEAEMSPRLETGPQAEVLDFFPVEWAEQAAEPELVAAASQRDAKKLWSLKAGALEIEGSFHFEWKAERLVFLIHRYSAKRSLRLRLLLYLKGTSEPNDSEEFEPKEGSCVFWTLPHGPDEVEHLKARVVN